MVCKTDIYWYQKPKTQYRNLLLPLSERRGAGRRFRQPAPGRFRHGRTNLHQTQNRTGQNSRQRRYDTA